MARVGVSSLSLPRDPAAPSLCAASCQLPAPSPCHGAVLCPEGCAMPQSCAVPRVSPTAHWLLPVPVGAWDAGQVAGGPGGLRSWRPAGLRLGSDWAQLLFLEEGGRCLSPPPAAVPGKGRDLPAPRFSQGEAEEGTRWRWPTCDTAVSCAQAGQEKAQHSHRAAVPGCAACGAAETGSLAGTRPAWHGPCMPLQGTSQAAVPGALHCTTPVPMPGGSCSCPVLALWHCHAPLTLCWSGLPGILWTGRAGC